MKMGSNLLVKKRNLSSDFDQILLNATQRDCLLKMIVLIKRLKSNLLATLLDIVHRKENS